MTQHDRAELVYHRVYVGAVVLLVALGLCVARFGAHWSDQIWVKLLETPSALAWPVVALVALRVLFDEIRSAVRRVLKAGPFEFADRQLEDLQAGAPADASSVLEVGASSRQIANVPTAQTAVAQTAVANAVALTPHITNDESTRARQSVFDVPPKVTKSGQVNAALGQVYKEFSQFRELGQLELERKLLESIAFERVYREFVELSLLIYGSQAKLLKRLAQSEVISAGLARTISKLLGRPDSVDAEAWQAWLLSRQLVELDGDSLRITPKAKEFLEWSDGFNLPLTERSG